MVEFFRKTTKLIGRLRMVHDPESGDAMEWPAHSPSYVVNIVVQMENLTNITGRTLKCCETSTAKRSIDKITNLTINPQQPVGSKV